MSKLYVTTTQNVPLFFTPASIGERIGAFFIDLLIKAAYIITLYVVFIQTVNIDKLIKDDDWLAVTLIFLLFLPVVFYTLACESLMEGQTFGKKLMKTKVIKIDGYQASFLDYFTRWIFRVVDIQMGYIPGLIALMTTKNTQRIGDLAAGTAVVTEKSKYSISHTILMDVEDTYQPFFTQNQALLFNDNDIRIIKENVNNATRNNDYELLNRLTIKIQEVVQMKNPFSTQREFIETLLKDYSHHTGK